MNSSGFPGEPTPATGGQGQPPDVSRGWAGARRDPYEPPPPDSDDTTRFVHAMTDEHLAMMVDIVCLEREIDGLGQGGRGKSVLGKVLGELTVVRDAAGAVVLDASDPDLTALFAPDGPLGVYLTGLLMWTRCVVQIMRAMAQSVEKGKPAWLATRKQLDKVGALYMAGLSDDSLSHAEEAPSSATAPQRLDFQRGLRSLIQACGRLHATLREGFTLTPAA